MLLIDCEFSAGFRPLYTSQRYISNVHDKMWLGFKVIFQGYDLVRHVFVLYSKKTLGLQGVRQYLGTFLTHCNLKTIWLLILWCFANAYYDFIKNSWLHCDKLLFHFVGDFSRHKTCYFGHKISKCYYYSTSFLLICYFLDLYSLTICVDVLFWFCTTNKTLRKQSFLLWHIQAYTHCPL